MKVFIFLVIVNLSGSAWASNQGATGGHSDIRQEDVEASVDSVNV